MLQVETEAPDAERSGLATRALRSRPALPPALAVCVCGVGGAASPPGPQFWGRHSEWSADLPPAEAWEAVPGPATLPRPAHSCDWPG